MDLPDGIIYLRAAKLLSNENEVLELTFACAEGQADGTISRATNQELYDFVMNNAAVIAGRSPRRSS